MSREVKPQTEPSPAPPLGIYLHVPFCARSCDYCAFYQEEPRRADLDRYLDTIETEVGSWRAPRLADTVFWGGGTPGLLPARDLLRLGRLLRPRLSPGPVEWSIELAPATVKEDKLEALREAGVNRFSLGVQSFQEHLLDGLGRPHHPSQVERALELLRGAGLERCNLDLIFGVPGQTLEEWREDLRRAVDTGVGHLSTYCLTYEEGTPLRERWHEGRVVKYGEEEEAAFYETTWAVLAEAGLEQYEISNFARPGRQCRHNLNTWAMAEWRGFGPSAASQIDGRRFANPASLEIWIEGIAQGAPRWVDVVELSPTLLATDSLIFGLRCNRGVDLPRLAARFPEFPWARMEPLWAVWSDAGVALVEPDGRLRLTPRGRLLADRCGVEILSATDPGG